MDRMPEPMTIAQLPAEMRPREKLLKHGAAALTDTELLPTSIDATPSKTTIRSQISMSSRSSSETTAIRATPSAAIWRAIWSAVRTAADPQTLANAIRFVSIDAIVRATEGHQGVPLGMAEIATSIE